MEANTEVQASRWPLLILLASVTIAVTFTKAAFMADSLKYAESIVPTSASRAAEFWDFGHLMWRALGRMLWDAFKWVIPTTDSVTQVITILGFVSRLATLLLTWVVWQFVYRLTQSTTIATFISAIIVFSYVIWNYASAATPYPIGLLFMMVAYSELLKSKEVKVTARRHVVIAGLAAGLALTMWFQFVFALPALVLWASVSRVGMQANISNTPSSTINGLWKFDIRCGFYFTLWSSVFVGVCYAVVMITQGYLTPSAILHWVQASAHGTDHISGVSRMILGWSRSFLSEGREGLIVKRYLLHDPYNPVTIADVLQLGLWKLLAFYLSIALAIVLFLWREHWSARTLILIAGFVPCLLFASKFDGSAIERYLPLFPALILGVAYAVQSVFARHRGLVLAVLLVIVITEIAVNGPLLSGAAYATREAKVHDAIVAAVPPPTTPALIVTAADESLEHFTRDFPLDPIVRSPNYEIYTLSELGGNRVIAWRELFAHAVLNVWSSNGTVWLAPDVLSKRPPVLSTWAEGDDPRIHWSDFDAFFRLLDIRRDSSIGGKYAFLPNTEHNRSILMPLNIDVEAALPVRN